MKIQSLQMQFVVCCSFLFSAIYPSEIKVTDTQPQKVNLNKLDKKKQKKIADENIQLAALEAKDETWFVYNYVKSFLRAYRSLTFSVGPNDNPLTLGPKDKEAKEKFLRKRAEKKFRNYVLDPIEGYKTIKVIVDGEPAGAFLFRLNSEKKIIYFAKFFVRQKFRRKGLASQIIEKEFRRMYPDYRRYEVLIRRQNLAGQAFINKFGFKEDKSGDIVRSYNRNPDRYIGFYKEFN